VTCLTCAHAALRDATDGERDKILRRMAAQGAINCLLSDYRAGFHATDHRCDRWEPAADSVTTARLAWADKHLKRTDHATPTP